MKKIIFDLDNTLILNDVSFVNYYVNALEDLGYESSLEKAKEIYYVIDEYDNNVKIYQRETLIEFINKQLNQNYNIKLVDRINYYIGKYWCEKNEEKKEVLDYLSKKYDLYVYTNWFTDCQKERLKNSGILNYFKEVVGSDLITKKPYKEGFMYFTKDCKPEECMMIGDSIKNDYEGAINANMKVILYDYNNQYENKYNKINNFNELKNIL